MRPMHGQLNNTQCLNRCSHTSLLPRKHLRQKFVRRPHDGVGVDCHDFADGSRGYFLEGFADDDSGIVDDDVDGADLGVNALSGRGYLSGIGEIHGVSGCGSTGRDDRSCSRLISL